MSRPASTKVFIDDYVVGRLPGICVVTGEPTTDQVRLRKNVSSANAVWFILILLGPVGWLVLLAVSLSSRNYLEGWLPYSLGKHPEPIARNAAIPLWLTRRTLSAV